MVVSRVMVNSGCIRKHFQIFRNCNVVLVVVR
jgi:hypothetical protein